MPMSRVLRKRRSEAQWNAILRRFATSGLSSREFCLQEGVALSSLQRWQGRLGKPAAAGEFFEMTPAPGSSTSVRDWTVELTLAGGVSLRLRG